MKIKICGVTHPDDAAYAAGLGTDFIGIIFSACSKRKVCLSLAKEITQAALQGGAKPVGVFVDETADQIISICEQIDLNSVQLHGLISKQALPALPEHYSIIYAFSVGKDGIALGNRNLNPLIMPLYDGSSGGTGKSFNWHAFSPPTTPWMLAGGLNPYNVREAIKLLKPYGVDVSTGVEFSNKIRKDPILIKAFIQAAKYAKENR